MCIRDRASVGDLPTLGDEVLGEEPLVRVVFMKLVGREDAGEHWHSGVELHPHQPADDGVGDELVTVDAVSYTHLDVYKRQARWVGRCS